MADKAIMRAFLILALIVTAHLIKPFSIKNVTQHLLYSARSFSFVLPSQLREKFDHANYLAINLSNGLFEADEGIRDFTRGMTAELAFGPINVQPFDEVNKSATKQKPCQKKSTPARRVKKLEKRGADQLALSNLVAIARTDEIRLVELPSPRMIEVAAAPFVPPDLTKFFPARLTVNAPIGPIEAAFKLRRKECERLEADQKARTDRINAEIEAKGVIWVVEKFDPRKVALSVSECETQEVTAEEEIKEDVVAPQAAEESKSSSFLSPFAKCSKDQ